MRNDVSQKAAANRMNGRKTRDPAMTEQIAQMVDAICAGDDDPLLRQQAVMIAENQLWLSCVKAEKVAAIERLRDPTASTLTNNARSVRAKARLRLCDLAHRELMIVEELIDKPKGGGRGPEGGDPTAHAPSCLAAPWVKEIPEDAERDEYEAMREGLCDLVRLLRYEQRAWSRRKKAVRAFMAIKLANQ